MIYANQAGTSWPKAPGVEAAVANALAAAPDEHAGLYERAHAAIAGFFGIPSPERLLLASSCTAATQLGLTDLPWQEGDVVVTSSLEHHALVRPVQRLVWDRGVVHVTAPYRPGVPIDLDGVETTLRRGRVRLVAVTGAANVTGERLPIAELTRLAHEHGALVLLDGAQLAGVVPVSVGALGVDALVFAGHKGMLGPQGIGGLWVAPHVEFRCPSATCEVGTGAALRAAASFPGFCDVGSVNLAGACGLSAAITWLDARTAAERERPLQLAARLRHELTTRRHCRVLGGGGEHTATVALLLATLPLERAQQHFAARGIVIRAGQHCAPMALAALGAPAGCVRISFGPQNGDADVDAVLAAIDAAS